MKNCLKFSFPLMLLSVCFSFAQQRNCNEGTLRDYSFSDEHTRKITLPKRLTEISGLAVTEDDRLFSHNDEIGTVYEIDIENGKILNQFYLGKKKLMKDFEGIAGVGDSLFLVTSSGVLYKFNYPDDERNVEYIMVKTFLTAKYDVEGLCYDKATNSLLLACKEYAGKNLKEYKAIYSFDLSRHKLQEEPKFLINLDSLKNKFNVNNFSPTGIEVHPYTGNIFILSSHEKAIIELSPNGNLLNLVKLNSKDYPQPEGISFLSDLSLLISDEGKVEKAKVTLITLNSNH